MVKLHIRDSGFLINIPGLSPFRTPAMVIINESDIKRIESELRKMGISNFEIKYDNIEQIKKTKKTKNKDKSIVKKIVEKIIKPTIIKETIDIKQINNRFDNIEELLKRIANKPGEVHITNEPGKIHKEYIKSEEDDFIPTVDTSDIKLGGSSIYSRVEDEKEKDLELKSKQLSKIAGNKGFKK